MKIRTGHITLLIFLALIPCGLKAQLADTFLVNKNIKLEEVSIIGQGTPGVYSQLARNITLISRDEIKVSPAQSIQDLLEYVSSVDIRQRNIHGVQADIQIRGGTFDQVMILLNGINISDPQTGHFNLDLPVELSSIDRIEILHGSGARIYGANAYKGVINIITKKNNNQFSSGLSYGQHNLIHANISGNLTKGKLFNGLSLSRNSSDGFTENTDYKINHLYYQGGLIFKPIDISWQAGINGKAFGANDFYSPSFPEQYEETSTRFGSLAMSSKGKIHFSGSAYWRSHKDHFLLKRDEPSFYENYHLTDILGMKLSAIFISSIGKTFVGMENRNENIYSTVLGLDSPHPRLVKGTDNVYYTKTYSRNTINGFFEQNYILNNFSITGGFLLDFNNELNQNIGIFPGLDISQRFLEEKLKVFASINRSLRLPTFTDMFYKDPSNEGNTKLKPEELLSLESGIEFNLDKYETHLTLFRDKGNQVIDWIWLTDLSIYKAMNIAEVTTRGIEISCKYLASTNKSGSLLKINKLGFAYTYIDLEKATGNYESKYSLDYLKHKLRAFTLVDITKKIHTDFQVSFVSRNGSYLDYDADTNTRFSTKFRPYWLADAKVYYSTSNLQVFTIISNLFDARYSDVGNLIQPGRWITVGFQINFDLSI